MPTTVVAFGKTAAGFVSSTTITDQDVGTGSDRAAYVMIGASNTNDTPSSVTVGSDSLTAQGGGNFTDSSGWRWRLYAGALTVTGPQTITATWSDGFNAKHISGVVLSGVDTATLLEDLTTANLATGTSHPSWTIDSATGDTVVALFVSDNSNTNTAASPAVALTGTGLGSGVYVFGMTEAGATSVSINSTLTTTPDVWRGFGFNVPAAAGDTAPTLTAASAINIGTTSATARVTFSR